MDDSRGTKDRSDREDEKKKRRTVHHQHIRAMDENPRDAIIRSLSAISGKEATKLKPLYSTIDHMIEALFSSPPPAESQAQLEFSWEGYRITVYHDGNVIFQENADG